MTKNIIFTGFIALLTLVGNTSTLAALPPSVSTLPATNIGQTSITFNGFYNANGSTTSTWFAYGTNQSNLNLSTTPVVQGTGSGSFSQNVTGLMPATKYYFQAMAYNMSGTAIAVSIQSATTSPLMGQVTTVNTLPVTGISTTSAQANAYYTLATNGSVWFQYGTSINNLAYSTTPVSKSIGSGSFSQNLTSLVPNTTYYVKAYVATNSITLGSMTTQSFKTGNITIPTSSFSLATLPATSITTNSAILNGYVTITGINTISLYFQYGTSVSSLTSSIPLADPANTSGSFSATLTNLLPNTTYYFKACGTNTSGASLCSITTQSFKTGTIVNPTIYACNDGVDNDNDGKIDYPNDPGCTSTNDNDEYNYVAPTTYACNDGVDNDFDGYTDMNDIGCSSQYDNDEYNPVIPPTTYACSDGYDNDNDGKVDMNDPGCTSSYDNDEYNYTNPTTYACSDGYDNDNDGRVDMNDIGCSSYYDNDEYNYIAPNPNPNPYPYPYPYPQPNPKTVIIYNNGNSYTNSIDYLDLAITSKFPNAYTGDTVTYTVTYKNTTSKTTLKNLVLEITLPEDMDFRNTESGTHNDDKIILKISTLKPGEKESFEIEGKISNSAKYVKSLTVKAKMTYETYSGAKGVETAYDTIDISDYSKSSIFSSFLPSTLLEWIILIIVIAMLIILGRKLYGEKK